ncbi:MAG TPA: class I SAM-dependent methyltransferase [Candidatus Elarobacter sp.]|nr:class I SAM-dependent methyltransferase [Candidatus Elarobacter sp.]
MSANALQRAGQWFFYSRIAEALFVNVWYSLVAKLDRDGSETFMNYGYAALDESEPALPERFAVHRCAVQLYRHVALCADVRDKTVLEVGCGRGGGASYVAGELGPRRYVGLDVNATAIAFDRARYRGVPNLEFVCGDAHALPFPDASFDAVLNVESSHHYRDLAAFLAEVRRVLVPGGTFVMACFPRRNEMEGLRRPLDSAGFELVLEEDITANVVRALELDSARRTDAVQRLCPAPLRTFGREFAGVRGSELYDSFASGKRRYLNFVLRAPAAGGAQSP